MRSDEVRVWRMVAGQGCWLLAMATDRRREGCEDGRQDRRCPDRAVGQARELSLPGVREGACLEREASR